MLSSQRQRVALRPGDLGADAAGALENARPLEWACTLYARAASLGVPRTLYGNQLQAVIDTVAKRGYRSLQERRP